MQASDAMMKAGHVPMGTPVVIGVREERRRSGWSTGLCDCAADCTSCWATLVCAPITMGQLWQRTRGSSSSCLKIGIVLGTLFVVVRLRGLSHWPSPFVPVPLLPSYYPDALELAWYYVWSNVYWVLFFVLTMIVRRTVRQRDGIAPTCCGGGGGCDDCLTSFFCQPCVQCQLMRHEGLTYGRYELFTEVGTREVV